MSPHRAATAAFWPAMDSLYKARRARDEWGRSDQLFYLVVEPAAAKARRLLIQPRASGILIDRYPLPRTTTRVSFHPIASQPLLARLREELRHGIESVGFIGDLDPFDLWSETILRAGLQSKKLAVRKVGIGDDWLALCRRFVRHPIAEPPWGLPTIALSAFETKALTKLDAIVPLAKLVEPNGLALLQSGHKLELEGASNPACYRDGFRSAFHAFLHRRLRSK